MAARDHRTKRRVSIRWKWLVVNILILGVVGTALAAAYRLQSGGVAEVVREQADQLVKQKKWRAAAKKLFNYLQFEPADTEARRLMAELYAKSATSRSDKKRAIELHFQALGQTTDPDQRNQLEERLAQLLLETGRYKDAKERARNLGTEHPEGMRIHALAIHQEFFSRTGVSDAAVVVALQNALKNQPGDLELTRAAAWFKREHWKGRPQSEREKMADALILRMLETGENPKDATAWMLAFDYWSQFRKADQASEALHKARELAPERPAVLTAWGKKLLYDFHRGNENNDQILEDAEAAFRKLVNLAPSVVTGYLALDEILKHQAEAKQAQEVLQKGVEAVKTADVALLHVRLVDSYIADGELEQAGNALDRLRRVRNSVSQQLSQDSAGRYLRYLNDCIALSEARIAFQENDINSVVSQIETLLVSQNAFPKDSRQRTLQFEAFLLLGKAYARTYRWEKAAKAYEGAATMFPQAAQVAFSAAQAYRSAGKLAASQRLLEKAASGKGTTDNIILSHIETRLQYQISLPKDQRNWLDFDRAFAKSENKLPDSWKLQVIGVQRFLADRTLKNREQAINLMDKASQLGKGDSRMWMNLVFLYHRMGLEDDSKRALGQFLKINRSSVDHHLVLARWESERGKMLQAEEHAKAAREAASADELPSTLPKLAAIYTNINQPEQARLCLVDLFQVKPEDVRVVYRLAEISLRENDFDAAERWEIKLRNLEGVDGVLHRLVRVRRMLQSGEPSHEIEPLQQEIDRLRPKWPPNLILKGDLLVADKQFDKAVDAYRSAIHNGGRRLSYYEKLLFTLYRMGRFNEADEYLEVLQEVIPHSGFLYATAGLVATELNRLPNAIRRAKETVGLRPADPMVRVWLANLLQLNEQTVEAEGELLRAVELAPTDIRPRYALFGFYIRDGKSDRASATLQQLLDNVDQNKQHVQLLVGSAYEKLGQYSQAVDSYCKFLASNPANRKLRLRTATLLVGFDLPAAEKEVRLVLQQSPESNAAKRLLATILARKGGADAWQETQIILKTMGKDGSADSVREQQLKAVVFAFRGGEQNLRQARDILVELCERQPDNISAGDLLLLANIHEGDGNISEAEAVYEALNNLSEKPHVGHLAAHFEFAFRNGDLNSAVQIADRLETAADKESWQQRMRYLQCRVQLLKASSDDDQIAPLVASLVAKYNSDIGVSDQQAFYARIGALYESVQQYGNAELWFQRLTLLSPQHVADLARVMTHQGKQAEAIKECLAVRNLVSMPRLLVALMSVLAVDGNYEDANAIDPILAEAVEKFSLDATVSSLVSGIYLMLARHEEALALLQQVEKAHPDHVVTLNNLATVLSDMPSKVEQGLQHIERAIVVAGHQPPLIDTKAQILLELGRPDEAISLLQRIVAVARPDPRFLLHLAAAYLDQGDVAKARSVLQRALSLGLESQILTGRDRERLEILKTTPRTARVTRPDLIDEILPQLSNQIACTLS